MHILIDIILLVMLAAAIFKGIKKGFISTILGFAVIVLSIVIASSFSSPMAESLSDTSLYSAVKNGISNTLISEEIKDDPEKLEDMINNLNATVPGLNLDSEKITEKLEDAPDAINDLIDERIVTPIANCIWQAMCFIIIFIVSMIVLKLASKLIELVAKLPLINLANKLLGGVIGLLIGVVRVYLLCFIVNKLVIATGIPTDIFDSTLLYSFFANFNPIDLIF